MRSRRVSVTQRAGRRLTPRVIVAATVALAAGIALAVPADALARAGGGEGWSGGRGGGGGKGGGGGGDSSGLVFLLFQLLRLCFTNPAIGIPLLIIVIAAIWYVSRQGKAAVDASVIRRGNVAAAQLAKRSATDALRAADPSFDADAFLARVRGAFDKIQHAWAAQDLADVRPFISDAVHERFSLQFDEQRALGYRNHMADVRVRSAEVTHARADALFDELSVRFAATAVDQKVSLADGRVLGGSPVAQPFEEVWTFLRRRGATTAPGKPGLMEGNCPNCGAPVEMNQSDNCQYCSALLRSGRYDWVLVEITQASEWETVAAGPVSGEDALRGRDPEFNRQELEDRASVVFWRLAAAHRVADVKPVRKMAFDAYLGVLAEEFRLARGQPRRYVGERAVGSVLTLGIVPAGAGSNGDGEAFDRALVEVRWSGTWFTAQSDGRSDRAGQAAVSRTMLVLARRAGATSSADKSVSSAHCPTCGAPEEGGSGGACQYCGTALNDGSKAWTLEDAVPMDAGRAWELLGQLRHDEVDAGADVDVDAIRPAPMPPSSWGSAVPGDGSPAPASVLAWMVHVACADGELHDRERRMLESVAARYHVPAGRLEQLVAAAQAGSLDLPAPRDAGEAEEHLKGMARVALADGRVSSEEQALLGAAGRQLGLSDHDVKMLVRRTQKEVVAAARGTLRAAKAVGRNGA